MAEKNCFQSSHGHSASGAHHVILSSIHDHIYKCHWWLERSRSSLQWLSNRWR